MVLMSGAMRLPVCRTGNAHKTDGPKRRELGMYPALDRCVMPALLRCPSHPCHKDDTGISTKNKSPSLSVTYKGYKECTFGPLASRRLPLWSVHPPDDNPTRMSASSTCPTEINGLESSGTCWTLCSTSVEPPRRLSSTVPIMIIAQCCEFPIRTKSECRSEYCQN